ncbi:MAG: hypothetical protein EZS28_018883 [Streblomastix strix]|uniref:Uncharacterized protein n=1 Tax=Streblomastix strix TaxID=222440 RepID=A0A5J4VT48_9EUKA|nr:MAG: hypothetical protein EZS28_018883 [Streblomastix strix]
MRTQDNQLIVSQLLNLERSILALSKSQQLINRTAHQTFTGAAVLFKSENISSFTTAIIVQAKQRQQYAVVAEAVSMSAKGTSIDTPQ